MLTLIYSILFVPALRTLRFFSTLLLSLSHSWFKLRWSPSSKKWLIQLDKKLRSLIIHKNHGKWVCLDHNGKSHSIWTVVVEGDVHDAIPIVAVHGLGGGSNMFINNIDSFAQQRDVYLLDLPGFGLSSRPDLESKYSEDGQVLKMDERDIEKFYTELLEKWLKEMGLEKIILLGHSYGAFICAVYSITYPNRIQHLILADPWGVPPKPEKLVFPSFKIRLLVYIISRFHYKVNIFTPIRALGPLGPSVFWSLRSDLHRRYAGMYHEDYTFFQYLYACNTIDLPSGEIGFTKVSLPFGYACGPILERVNEWSPNLDVTFIYGEKSWITSQSGFKVKNNRHIGYVDVQIVKGAGHHVHTDRSSMFNHIIRLITKAVDEGKKPNITEKDIQKAPILSSPRYKPSHPSQSLICNDEAGIRLKRSHDNTAENKDNSKQPDDKAMAGGDSAYLNECKSKSKVSFSLGEES